VAGSTSLLPKQNFSPSFSNFKRQMSWIVLMPSGLRKSSESGPEFYAFL
jgi:hypothetical protein